MDRLLESLRKNPDVIAIAVLCLLLGLGRQAPPRWSDTAFQAAGQVGIHDLLLDVEEAAGSVHTGMCLRGWHVR